MLEIPWVAVADLLLSPLCDEVGEELYEMDGAVRNLLLARLKQLAGFDPLLVYARGMEKFVHDDWEGAVAEFDKVSGGDRKFQVAGINLPIPESIPEFPNIIPIVAESKPLLINSDVLEIKDITQKPSYLPSKKLYNRDVYMVIDRSAVAF